MIIISKCILYKEYINISIIIALLTLFRNFIVPTISSCIVWYDIVADKIKQNAVSCNNGDVYNLTVINRSFLPYIVSLNC